MRRPAGGQAGGGLGHVHGAVAVGVVGVDAHGGVGHRRRRLLVGQRAVDQLVLDGLERADGLVELHPLLGVGDRRVEQPSGDPDHLGGDRHRRPLDGVVERGRVERLGSASSSSASSTVEYCRAMSSVSIAADERSVASATTRLGPGRHHDHVVDQVQRRSTWVRTRLVVGRPHPVRSGDRHGAGDLAGRGVVGQVVTRGLQQGNEQAGGGQERTGCDGRAGLDRGRGQVDLRAVGRRAAEPDPVAQVPVEEGRARLGIVADGPHEGRAGTRWRTSARAVSHQQLLFVAQSEVHGASVPRQPEDAGGDDVALDLTRAARRWSKPRVSHDRCHRPPSAATRGIVTARSAPCRSMASS